MEVFAEIDEEPVEILATEVVAVKIGVVKTLNPHLTLGAKDTNRTPLGIRVALTGFMLGMPSNASHPPLAH